MVGSAPAIADPVDTGSSAPEAAPEPAHGSARVTDVKQLGPQRTALFIDSPAMHRVVQVQILHPVNDKPRPSLYLLDGVDAGNDQNTWTERTDAAVFFADKNVNVVLPVGGAASYYTDWKWIDPVLGVNAWETFLTGELPSIVDARFDGTGANAVAGLSMGGHAALNLITRHPQLYRGVAAYSSCPDSTDANAQQSVRATVASRGGNATNMWGPDNDPDWAAHDPVTNADALRGKSVYLSVGNGLVGPGDLQSSTALVDSATGVGLELLTMNCTRQFQARLDSLRIPAQFVYRPVGTHSWPYWQEDLHNSWPTLAKALG
ncbi:esterase family protein [Aldersonia sp. NBC_00410]|uniref:alpha/beta hydrolase n=1 Tax=Aldersonia sp. NBC_00410 TaxID=2975954 RepID=UPI00225950C7|nr:alpha/beta hydrolase family protein [Aldersonia sp. NBC_00410]MCX5042143.1 esterase family protein [Aldersonia sp. NBC_00410]